MNIIDAVYVYRMFMGRKASWNGRYHSHKEGQFEIHFFVEGAGSFLSNKKRIPIRNKTMFLTLPQEFHSILPDRIVKPITYYAILFSLSPKKDRRLYEFLSRLSSSAEKKQNVEESSIQFIFEEIFHSANSKSKILKKSAELLMQGLIYRFFMGDKAPVSERRTDIAADFPVSGGRVEQSIKIMEERIYQNLKIEDLAGEMGISPEHYIRIFRKKMNITPLQYFYRLKIKTAAAMICNTDLSISDISKKMSFENPFHFSRIFKKCAGLSPSAYRKLYGAGALF
ncbi:AraC family transcriptional regulator [Treponema parvum]|uniref:AraC family transcriptional regulator n=1 Tax=Treponema parvum TaxID=138851 RepID=UPI001AEC3E0B|nr:AraC family transcriptional regulator [Treponema parvum]QTQ16906.1 AraC family transcriptional regulator [Treponema parvum]